MRRIILAPISYVIQGTRQELILLPEVLAHFERHRQSRRNSPEAGGQLIASFEDTRIVVRKATGPYPSDYQSRYLFKPDRAREQKDINVWFKRGLHFIGNWHTHPEEIPYPSRLDVANTRRRFLESKHELMAFTLVIVGLRPFPNGLWASLVNKRGHRQIHPTQRSQFRSEPRAASGSRPLF